MGGQGKIGRPKRGGVMRRPQIQKRSKKKYRTEKVEDEVSYTFSGPTWMCFFVIVVACTFKEEYP